MSKWSKLQKDPVLFFKDMWKKRLGSVDRSSNTSTKGKSTANYQFNPFFKYTHLLHTGENASGLSHLDLWIPHFINAEIKFVVMVRNNELFELVKKKYPQLTLLYAKGDKEVERYIEKMLFLKACFYPSNTGNNLHLLKFNEIKHIFIGHGDSDKTASAHKYFRVYDENWVAGEAHIDRFRNAGFDFSGLKQVKVGRPNLKETLLISQTPWQERFNGNLNLLYLSTWEGVYEEQDYTSVYLIDKFFEEIKDKNIFDTIGIKLHPWVGRRDTKLLKTNAKLNALLSNSGVDYNLYDKTMPVEEIIKISNVFICDISAVISESLAANTPIFVYMPKEKDIKLSQSSMSYEDYTYVFSSIEELMDKIEEVIVNGNDYLAEKREEAMEYILGRDETLNDEFIEQLKRIEDGRC